MSGGLSTGQIRAMLQPVVFVKFLVGFAPDFEDDIMEAGEIAGLQYWGNGDVAVTPTRLGGRSFTVKAHDLAGKTRIVYRLMED